MGKRKPNNQWLAQQQAKKEYENRLRWFISKQFLEDCMMIAINRVFHRKGAIMEEVRKEYQKIYDELAWMLFVDGEDDEDFWYTKEKVDRQLREIMGDNFKPWDERYDYSGVL